MLGCEPPTPELDAHAADPAEATVARAVALLKAYGHFQRARELTTYTPGERTRLARRILLAQDRLVALLAPSWTPERRAAVALLTEPDAAIWEIEAKAREGENAR